MFHILIKDTLTIYAKGISEIIRSHFINTSIVEANSNTDLAEKINQQYWDIIILDAGKEDLSLLNLVKKNNPETTIIITTHVENPLFTTVLKSAGASFILIKSCSEDDFIKTVEKAITLEIMSKKDGYKPTIQI